MGPGDYDPDDPNEFSEEDEFRDDWDADDDGYWDDDHNPYEGG